MCTTSEGTDVGTISEGTYTRTCLRKYRSYFPCSDTNLNTAVQETEKAKANVESAGEKSVETAKTAIDKGDEVVSDTQSKMQDAMGGEDKPKTVRSIILLLIFRLRFEKVGTGHAYKYGGKAHAPIRHAT